MVLKGQVNTQVIVGNRGSSRYIRSSSSSISTGTSSSSSSSSNSSNSSR